jgi:hypothetical protein
MVKLANKVPAGTENAPELFDGEVLEVSVFDYVRSAQESVQHFFKLLVLALESCFVGLMARVLGVCLRLVQFGGADNGLFAGFGVRF